MRHETLIGEVEMSRRLIALVGERAEHPRRDAGVRAHPCSDERRPCRGRRSPSISSAPIASSARASARRVAGTSSCGTENESAAEPVRDVLEDRVDVDVLGGDGVEDRGGDAGPVGEAA